MNKMSINFDNEEQYKNFIQSIKDEVLKEIPTQRNKHQYGNARTWNYTTDKICELGLQPREVTKLRNAFSTILQYGFKTNTIHFIPDERHEEVVPLIDELFNVMNKIRKYKRTEGPYKDNWKTKEEQCESINRDIHK